MNPSRQTRPRGVFLLPNALTTGGLFAGFYSIIAGINGQYSAAAIAIIVAGVLDGLDGRVARLTNTQSEFGVQYDSLADMVSFGLAPALLAFNWSLQSLGQYSAFAGKLGWLATFVYVACAALRLARFNAQAGHVDRTWFQGLASPAAAGTLVVTVWFFDSQGVAGDTVSWLMWLETVALGILMFSRVRYFSFKSFPRGEKVPIAWIFLLVLAIVLLSLDPPSMMLVLAIAYVASGIVMTLLGRRNRKARRLLRHRRARRDEASESEAADSPTRVDD
jgi:CDP-diacylglycerol--serine O-phosphatidyltransferase